MHDDLAMSPTDSPNGQFDCATAGEVESDPSTAPEGHHSTPSATPTRRSGYSSPRGLAGGSVPRRGRALARALDTAYANFESRRYGHKKLFSLPLGGDAPGALATREIPEGHGCASR